MQAAERAVMIRGNVLLYGAKAPYENSGVSIRGALEFDQDEDKIRCHECGEWFAALGNHIRLTHGITVAEYKRTHGLAKSTALICERVRVGFSTWALKMNRLHGNSFNKRPAIVKNRKAGYSPSAEYLNEKHICPAQLIEKLRTIATTVGHTPSGKELKEHGVGLETLKFRFGSVAKAHYLAGLEPNRTGVHVTPSRVPPRLKYSDEMLLELLRNFISIHDRLPTSSDGRRCLMPSRNTFSNRFGSWKAALRRARIIKVARGRKGSRTMDKWYIVKNLKDSRNEKAERQNRETAHRCGQTTRDDPESHDR